MGELASLFDPARVAVVGATEREGSIGRAITDNLLADFEGEVVPVNPNYEEVLGTPCVPAVDAAGDPDLAVIVVPPTIAVDAVREAGEAGVRNVVVITAGFGETGGEGAARERELAEVAAEHDLNLVGPNSLGVMSTPSGLNATFGPENGLPGSVSFMSQSGAFVTAVLDWANDQGLGFKDVVSLGNKAVLDETDFVREWADDPETDVVLGYLEGIEDGEAFIETAREATKSTPIVAIKSGRTEAGARAVSSHTGTLAGSEQAYETGLDQAGVIRAENVEELFDFASVLERQPLPDSDAVAVVTNAGGPGVMATDAIGESSLSLASFTEGTLSRLQSEMPEEANIHDPVDVIGDADLERFRTATDAVLADENVGMAVVVSAPTAVLDFEEIAEAVAELREKHGKPVAACLMGGERSREPGRVLRERGIPNYFDPARAVRSLDALARYGRIREREYEEPAAFDVDRERAREVLAAAAERGDNRVGVEAMELLEAYGIPTPEGRIVDDPAEAEEAAREIVGRNAGDGGDAEPTGSGDADAEEGDDGVVMKIVSPDILHKSDIGGVRVGVPVGEVRDAYEDLVTRARNYRRDATILGVQVQEMVDLDRGTETILGMNRDPQFGPLLLFGLGGIFVEILEDTSFRVAPVSEREAREMVNGIDAAPLLRGARGREPVDLDAVVESVQRLSQLVTDFPAILELDVNPLVATPHGVRAVDIRLTVDQEEL